MKKNFYLFAATAAMLLTACSGDDANNVAEVVQEGPTPVAFDTYMANATRSGEKDVMTNTTLKTTGFGVFAAQTNGTTGKYAGTEKPDFMYNQQVTSSGPSWAYTPLKYWPNETKKDNQSALSDTRIDVLSFFAYAPYVTANPSTGAVTATKIADTDNTTPSANAIDNVGIFEFSDNNDPGDPLVSYQIAYTPSKSVDLLWGVAPAGGLDYKTVNPDYLHTTIEGVITEGMPLLSLIKPTKDQKIKFLFKHALARLGMDVVLAVDQISPGGTLGDGTKVYVNSVTIEDAGATIPVYGKLNLNNVSAGVAKWQNPGPKTLKLVINSGRELNPELIGSTTSTTQPGVTVKEKNVIKDGKYFMLIPTPGTAATLDVTINYDVITADSNVDGSWTTTNNVITKQITLNSTDTANPGFTNNKAYNLKLILGLTSVKLNAEVADWEVDGSIDVNLPQNRDNE